MVHGEIAPFHDYIEKHLPTDHAGHHPHLIGDTFPRVIARDESIVWVVIEVKLGKNGELSEAVAEQLEHYMRHTHRHPCREIVILAPRQQPSLRSRTEWMRLSRTNRSGTSR